MRGNGTRPAWPLLTAALLALLGVLAFGGAAAGAGGADDTVVVQPEYGTVDDAIDTSAPVPIMIELSDPSTAATWASERGKGNSKADAAAAAKAQKDKIDKAQQQLLKHLEGKNNVSLIYRVQAALNGVAVNAPVSSIPELRDLPGVKSVSQITLVQPDNATTVPLIGAPAAWSSYGKTGKEMRIGIIDTGIDYVHTNFGGTGSSSDYDAANAPANNPATAPDDPNITSTLGSFSVQNGGRQIYPTAKVVGGFDFAGDAYNAAAATGSPALTPHPDPNPEDCSSAKGLTRTGGAGGHGSHVAGTAAGYGVNTDGTTYMGPYDTTTPFDSLRIGPGVAPEAKLYALRVFGCIGSTSLTTEAIDWATDPNRDGDPSDHLDVINMSLGSAYGTPDDESATASDNAAKAGVVVVASAGNSNDVYYVSGSPGSSQRTLSVAAMMDPVDVVDGFDLIQPSGTKREIGTFSVAFPWPGSGTKQGTLVYNVAGNTTGCSPFPAGSLTGKVVLLDWAPQGTSNFPCGSVARGTNAANAGAAGIIMASGQTFFDTSITGSGTVRAIFTTYTVGAELKAALAANPTDSVQINFNANYLSTGKYVTDGNVDTVSSFSSRGPRGLDSIAKPDIAAPGQSVFSTDSGTGNRGRSLNGTSMAAPHMSGVMALLRQAHPTWSVEELKALAMNTASQDLYTGLNHTGDRYGVGRVGAGRVNVPNALSTDVVAYDAAREGAVSVSFGSVEVQGSYSADRKITLDNRGGSDATYTVGYVPRTTVPGVSYSFPDGNTVTVPAGGTATVTVRLSADASAMRNVYESTIQTVQTNAAPNPRQWLNEAGGNVTFTPSSGTGLRVPVYAVVRPASKMTTVEGGFANTAAGTLHLTGTGVGTGLAGEHNSLVSAFELQADSPKAALPPDYPENTRHGDIHYVGIAESGGKIYVALTTWRNFSTPATEVPFSVYFDTNGDGHDDFQLFATRFTDTDTFVDALAPIGATSGPSQGFLNVFSSGTPTAIFNSNVLVMPVNASALGLAPGQTFKYHVTGFSRFWGPVDDVTGMSYTYGAPGISFTGAVAATFYSDQPGGSIPYAYNAANYTANHDLGILLLHHYNTSGNKEQVLQPTAPVAPSVTVSAPTTQYSDATTLTATLSPATNANTPATGTVQFSVDGTNVGSPVAVSNGTASIPYTVLLAAGSHAIAASYTPAANNSLFLASSGTGTLAVTREDTTVTPSAGNIGAITVTAAGSDKSKPFSLSAAIAEVADGSLGDIAKATPVTCTLSPVAAGTTYTATATLTVSGGTETAACTFSNVAVNVYTVTFGVGGSYYSGTGTTTMVVYDPSAGNVTGGGWLMNNGVRANFGFNVSYTKSGNAKGQLIYVEHRSTGDVVFKSTAMQTAAVTAGHSAVIEGKGVLNGNGGYAFRTVVTDNGEPGTSDTFGLTLTSADIAFAPVTISGGNIRVP